MAEQSEHGVTLTWESRELEWTDLGDTHFRHWREHTELLTEGRNTLSSEEESAFAYAWELAWMEARKVFPKWVGCDD